MKCLLSTFLMISLFSVLAQAQVCLQRRGVLDIGSGSTKAFAAVVDVCNKTIQQVLYEGQKRIPFNDMMEKNEKKEISSAAIAEVLPEMQELLQEMKAKDVLEISGIATSAFRTASNGERALMEISKKLGVGLKVISQRLEAEVGAISALAEKDIPFKNRASVIVWDIGGGSMQMFGLNPLGSEEIFQGDLASLSFKNKVIKEIQKKDIQKVNSPNPLGSRRKEAIALAEAHAQKSVPSFFKNKASDIRWIGTGGVLATSLQKQIAPSKKEFTRKELQQTFDSRASLSDEEVGGDYRATDITNMALVLGYMKALGIKKIETTSAPLARGWLLYKMSPN